MSYRQQANTFSDKQLTTEEAVYIAGLFDGEGSLYLVARKGKGRRSHHFHPEMEISNTDLAVLEWLCQAAGNGGIWLSQQPGTNHRIVYIWKLMPSQIRHVLPQILPYLRIKRGRAELMLEFFDLQRHADRGPWGEADPTVISRLLAVYQELRSLNKRGLTDSQMLEFSVGEPKERKRTCDHDGCDHRRYATYAWCYKHWLEQREPIQGTCEWCHEPFESVLPHARFCSNKCQWQAGRFRREGKGERRVFACPVCSKEVTTTDPRKLTCSQQCYSKMQYEKRKAEGYFERRKAPE